MAKWFRRKKETAPSEGLSAWGETPADANASPASPSNSPADGAPEPSTLDSPDAEKAKGPWIAFFHSIAARDEADRVREFARSFAEAPKAERFGVDRLGTTEDELTQVFLSEPGGTSPDLPRLAEQWLQLIREDLKPTLDEDDYLGLSLADPAGGSRMLTARYDRDCPNNLLIERVRVDEAGNAEPIPIS